MKDRKMMKEPQVVRTGNTVNVLVDLGNCFHIEHGQCKLSRANVDEYLKKCLNNVRKFDEKAQKIYTRDLRTLENAMRCVTSYKDTATLSYICREYHGSRRRKERYVMRYTEEDFQFAASISKRLGNYDAEDILDENGEVY